MFVLMPRLDQAASALQPGTRFQQLFMTYSYHISASVVVLKWRV